MNYVMTISPDFNIKFVSGWFVFNTWLQRQLGQAIKLDIFMDFPSQQAALESGRIDLIYANPYCAATLVREKGFVPIAKPLGRSDEAIIATRMNSPIKVIEDLKPGVRVGTADDPDVHMMCMIMLEPADLNAANIEMNRYSSFIAVAKHLLRDECDVGFFLADMFTDLSSGLRKDMRIVVQSQIFSVHHALLASPRMASMQDAILTSLTGMNGDARSKAILGDMGIAGWEAMSLDDAEFMIDLMDTLTWDLQS
jgi:phosphonate transport system substrate-binding protein